jgi:hypothetical protein
MKNTVTVLILALLIVGGLGVNAYINLQTQMLKTFVAMTPAERTQIMNTLATKRAGTGRVGTYGFRYHPDTNDTYVVPVSSSGVGK